MTGRILLFLLTGTVLAASGQVLFKVGAMGRVNAMDFVNSWIAFGLVAYGAGTLLWIYSLSKAPLTVVYPFTALTFVLVYVFGVVVLRESTSVKAMIGVVLVLIGLFMISTH